MHPFAIALWATLPLTGAYDALTAATLKQAAADSPPQGSPLAGDPIDIREHERLLRSAETAFNNTEERVAVPGLEMAAYQLEKASTKTAKSLWTKTWAVLKTIVPGSHKQMQFGKDALTSLKNMDKNAVKVKNGVHYVVVHSEKVRLRERLMEQHKLDGMVEAYATIKDGHYSDFAKDLARKLREEQFLKWWNEGKSPFQVVPVLKIGPDGMLAQKLKMLEGFIAFRNHRVLNNDEFLLGTLVKGLKGEDKLASLIGIAKTNRDANSAAEKLERLLMDEWHGRGVKPLKLLEQLGMDKSVDDLFSSKLDTVVKYVAEFNTKNTGAEFSLLAHSRDRYKDKAVVNALITARQESTSASTKAIAKRWQSESLKDWYNHGKAIDEVVEELIVGQEKAFTLRIEACEEYIGLCKPGTSDGNTLLKTLVSLFGSEDKLASFIGQMRTRSDETSGAKKLERLLMDEWHGRGVKPLKLLELLGMDKSVDDLFSSKLDTVVKYVAEFNTKNTGAEFSLLAHSRDRYKDKAVVNALIDARQESTSASTKAIAKRWQSESLKDWYNHGKAIDEVVEELIVGQEKAFTLRIEACEEYIGLCKPGTSDDNTLLKTLVSLFGSEDKLASFIGQIKTRSDETSGAKKLERLLMDEWHGRGVKPLKLLELLGMDKSVDDLFSSKLDTVVKYVAEFNTKNTGAEFSLLAHSRDRYKDKAVVNALIDARQEHRGGPTADIAEQWQKELLKSWLSEDKSIEAVLGVLQRRDDQVVPRSAEKKLETLKIYIQLFNTKNHRHGTGSFPELRGDAAIAIMLWEAMAEVTLTTHAFNAYKTELFAKWRGLNLTTTDVRKMFSNVGESNVAYVDSIASHYETFSFYENSRRSKVGKWHP
ncbi:unnamed protein product [Hyaloperonospora brassicae]|uniref:RxLR effector candidate protein n=1 Tax=Hyaloperonospora brassicae TaxID=162125 RepID=A0AAV0V5W2_HYABA|nr:unnamed protein product [Hyaloperonospora brassicae]